MPLNVRNIDIRGLISYSEGAAPTPPAPPVPGNFKYNTLLLPGTGANNATNNTFVDSSSNNFTVTRSGNTTQGSFSPFSTAAGYYSNYFDGTGDYLSVADASDFDFPNDFSFGSGDDPYHHNDPNNPSTSPIQSSSFDPLKA
jgi:hypothetical protein